jgi:hypothetical protein
MGNWNYRVVRKDVYLGKTIAEEVQFAIHETYYNDEGVPTAITTDPMKPYGETVEELRADLERMCKALGKSVLNWEDFGSKETQSKEVKNVQALGSGDRK